MTVFDTLFIAIAVPPLQEVFGEPVTYTDPDGTQTRATAILSAEELRDGPSRDGRDRIRTREATIFKTDVAVLSKRGTVIIDAEIWPIDEILHDSGSQTVVSLVRTESAERSRAEFRRAT